MWLLSSAPTKDKLIRNQDDRTLLFKTYKQVTRHFCHMVCRSATETEHLCSVRISAVQLPALLTAEQTWNYMERKGAESSHCSAQVYFVSPTTDSDSHGLCWLIAIRNVTNEKNIHNHPTAVSLCTAAFNTTHISIDAFSLKGNNIIYNM